MKEHFLRIYIIEIVSVGSSRISQEEYFSLEDAQDFIKKRAGTVEKISNFQYQSRDGATYNIHDILLRGKKQ